MSDRKKLALIELRVTTVVEVPADWGEEEIHFFYAESSHCLDNELRDLLDYKERSGVCTCHRTQAVVIDANPTPEDLELYLLDKHREPTPEGQR